MGRCDVAALVALATILAPVQAAAQVTFDPVVVERIASGCTAESAFGHAFAEVAVNATRYTPAPPGWTPFDRFDVYRTEHSGRMWKVDAIAFAGFGADADRETLLALTKAVDDAVQAGGRFATREVDGHTVIFRDLAGEDGRTVERGVELEITPLLGMVWATCSDTDLAEVAQDEFFGRAPITERPLPPLTAPAARLTEEACGDPGSRKDLVNRFAGAPAGLSDMGSAAERYFSRLTLWYGQQLVEAGVWTDDDKLSFALDILDDPVINRELEGQMSRLQPYMLEAVAFQAAEGARDEIAACQAAIHMMQVGQDMTLSNERQWLRARALYEAEADRLGVELE